MNIPMNWKIKEYIKNYERSIIFKRNIGEHKFYNQNIMCHTQFSIKLKEVLFLYSKNDTKRILQSLPELKEKQS